MIIWVLNSWLCEKCLYILHMKSIYKICKLAHSLYAFYGSSTNAIVAYLLTNIEPFSFTVILFVGHS